MSDLVRYDTMVNAIAECARVDEVKDIRDKAAALEAYYRQARNLEAERQAANVRLRAERRAGELLKELARAEPEQRSVNGRAGNNVNGDDEIKSPYASALSDSGMSRQTAHQYQAQANVPEQEFNAVLEGPSKPSRAAIIRQAKPEPKVNDDALWLWGRLRDFERMGYFDRDPCRVLDGMTDAMRADVLRLAPVVADFLRMMDIEHEFA